MDGENLGDPAATAVAHCRAIGDGWERLVEMDFALARTFAGIYRRPGQMVLDYIGGRRLAYSNPFRYALVITTLCVIAIHLLDIDVTAPGVPVETERDRAALQRLASRSTRFNYAELLVFDAYCIGHGSLIALLVINAVAIAGLL